MEPRLSCRIEHTGVTSELEMTPEEMRKKKAVAMMMALQRFHCRQAVACAGGAKDKKMAERAGFEPAVHLLGHTIA